MSSERKADHDPFLAQTSLQDVIVHKFASGVRPAYMISYDTPLREALTKMRDKKVRSLPVFVPSEKEPRWQNNYYDRDSEEEKSEDSGFESSNGRRYEFVSIVSVLDILLWFAWKSEDSDSSKVSIGSLAGVTKESEVLWTYPASMKLDEILQPFVSGVHTVLVDFKDPGGEEIIPVVISQTDVVRYMVDHADKLDQPLLDSTIEDAKLVGLWKPVWCVNDSKSAIDCFRVMADERISAVPVVDDGHFLRATLSSSDARSIVSEDFETKLKNLNVIDFLKAIESPGVGEQLTITPRTSIRRAMQKMIENHVHRLWVIDENGSPISCVTLSDIICKFSVFDFYGN